MTLLIVGATGSIGQKVTKQALTAGYQVTCLVREKSRTSFFLEEMGARVVYGDLRIPESLPPAFKGISIVIYASTPRLINTKGKSSTIELQLYRGKVALIKAAQVAKIKKFIAFSVLKNFFRFSQDRVSTNQNSFLKFQSKILTELKNSPFEHKIFMLSGLIQSLVDLFFVPMLEKNKKIKLLRKGTTVSYVSALDVAKVMVTSLSDSYMLQNVKYQIFGLGLEWSNTKFLLDQRFWKISEVFSFWDRLLGKTTPIQYVSESRLLNLMRFISFFKGTSVAYVLLQTSMFGPFFQLSKRTRIIYSTFSKNAWHSYFPGQKPLPLERFLQEFYGLIKASFKKVGFSIYNLKK